MKVAVIGGGITGLTAGFKLSKFGDEVFIFEKENYLGGLTAGFKKNNWQWSTEYFFHHFFTSDYSAKELLSELGLTEKLFYVRPKTSIFKNGKISQFDSPVSILTFPHLSLLEKLRTGLITFYLRTGSNWRELEKITAKDWLEKFYGQRVYRVLWGPLLEAKFGPFVNKVSMAWLWARIKKRSSKLGYLEGGFQILINKLSEKIKENKGRIFLNHEIKDLNDIYSRFDKIVITTPLPVFLKITSKKLPEKYKKTISQLKFVGALNLILVLKEKFLIDDTYWLNINEKDFPFVAVVEHTNFVNHKHYGGESILYVGGYYFQDHHYFKMSKEEVFKEFLPYLKKINPKLDARPYKLYSSRYAQPVMPLNYSEIIPKIKTPLKNIYLANQSLIYPWDRGVNYGIKLGGEVSGLI